MSVTHETKSEADPKTLNRQNRRAVAVQWGLVLGVIVLVEAAAALVGPPASPLDRGERFYPPTRQPSAGESIINWQLERVLRTPAELVLIGDSSALYGLDPAVFGQATGLRAQNFGMQGGLGIQGAADTLATYIAHHGPPTAVVFHMGTLIHTVPGAFDAAEISPAFQEWIGAASTHWPLPLPSLEWRALARALADGRHYSAAYTEAARGPWDSDSVIRDWLDTHDGFYVDRLPRHDWDAVPYLKPELQPEAEAGLRSLFELSAEHDVALFVAHNPIPGRYESAASHAHFRRLEERIVAISEGFPAVHVLTPFDRFFPTEAFSNYEHLSPIGAEHNSTQLGRVVARSLGLSPPTITTP